MRNNAKNKKTKQKKAVRKKMTVARCAVKRKVALRNLHKYICHSSVKFTDVTK